MRAILEIEAYAVIYIHPKISNEAGFVHRQSRLARTRPEIVCCLLAKV